MRLYPTFVSISMKIFALLANHGFDKSRKTSFGGKPSFHSGVREQQPAKEIGILVRVVGNPEVIPLPQPLQLSDLWAIHPSGRLTSPKARIFIKWFETIIT
jgi:hypothetical protein